MTRIYLPTWFGKTEVAYRYSVLNYLSCWFLLDLVKQLFCFMIYSTYISLSDLWSLLKRMWIAIYDTLIRHTVILHWTKDSILLYGFNPLKFSYFEWFYICLFPKHGQTWLGLFLVDCYLIDAWDLNLVNKLVCIFDIKLVFGFLVLISV